MIQPKISWPQAKYIATDLVRRKASSLRPYKMLVLI